MSVRSYRQSRISMPAWQAVLATAVLILALGSHAIGRTLHVSQKSLPEIASGDQVRTIGAAVSGLEAGDEVIIHGGIYREEVVVDKSGSADKPITIRAAKCEYVVLTGADRIMDWTQEQAGEHVYSTHWPYEFITWSENNAHPGDDEYHRLIGRAEQVFVNGYALLQVLERDKLARGNFSVDLDAQRLYVHNFDGQDIRGDKAKVEASTRARILIVDGDYVTVQGLRFRYAANQAQQGAVEFAGNHITVADCVFEYTNASGAKFTGENISMRNCVLQNNGQLGFNAERAHGLLMTDCVVRNNNTKGFNRGWEAGGNKIILTRGAVLEYSTFVENRGNGIWIDIGNEDCEVHNCLIAFNEDAGIFYEISYGLHAHDNVIVGNGFAFPGSWMVGGISISSSPDCIIERNLLVGNQEGFNFREQNRSTRRIEGSSEEPIWNHDEVVRNNVLAYNRDTQVGAWFDISDERHWPRSMQTGSDGENAGLSLEDLHFTFEDNLYCPGPGQGLFKWGAPWKRNTKYGRLDAVREALGLGQGSEVAEFDVLNYASLDFRVPADSPALSKGCYPRGDVPGVRLGTLP